MTRAFVGFAILLLPLFVPPAPARAQNLDTVRLGERIRIVAPVGGAYPATFLEADSSSVLLAGVGGAPETRIDRSTVARVDMLRGKDFRRGFRKGAAVGAILGALATGAVVAFLLECNYCDGSDDVLTGVATLAAIIIPPPTLLFGVLGTVAAPDRWQPAVLPLGPQESYLAAPDLRGTSISAFARSEGQASELARLRQRQEAAGVRSLKIAVHVDPTRSGPPEVSYFDRADAGEAAVLAFWLRQVLDRPELMAQQHERLNNAHHLEVWLGN